MPLRRRPGGIVQAQPVSSTKLSLAKEMRREMTSEERIVWNHLQKIAVLDSTSAVNR